MSHAITYSIQLKNKKKAQELFNRYKTLCKESNVTFQYDLFNYLFGDYFLKENEPDSALAYLKKSLYYYQTENDLKGQAKTYRLLSETQGMKRDLNELLKYVELANLYGDSVIVVDSINTAKAKEDQLRMFELESVVDAKDDEIAIKELSIQQEKSRRNYLLGGGGLLLVLLLLAVYAFRQKQKANVIIQKQKEETENQKLLVEVKNKEITDSINYAQRIQRALLASKELLEENLSEYFIIFKPKDIVSGDFYWATAIEKDKQKLFYIATADSTGHGVPGAIMSMLNISSFNESMKEGFTEPSDILNCSRNIIIQTLAKDGSAEGGKDGMDASLICIDFANMEMKYAAANNPIWIIRNHSSQQNQTFNEPNVGRSFHSNSFSSCIELIELYSDKMPIGRHDKQHISFSKGQIKLHKGDLIYTFTDGFVDQFGGEKGKKFKASKLKELLLSVQHETIERQKEIVDSAFEIWKGNHEQIDDVCIIGVKI